MSFGRQDSAKNSEIQKIFVFTDEFVIVSEYFSGPSGLRETF